MRISERLALCHADVAERPYSHPVTTGWYAEDMADVRSIIRDYLLGESGAMVLWKLAYGEDFAALRSGDAE